MDTQRGAGRLYFNPALAGHPAGNWGHILAGYGRRAATGHARASGVCRVYTCQSGSSRSVIITQ